MYTSWCNTSSPRKWLHIYWHPFQKHTACCTNGQRRQQEQWWCSVATSWKRKPWSQRRRTISVLFQAEDGIRDLVRSRGLGDVYKRQDSCLVALFGRPRDLIFCLKEKRNRPSSLRPGFRFQEVATLHHHCSCCFSSRWYSKLYAFGIDVSRCAAGVRKCCTSMYTSFKFFYGRQVRNVLAP